MKPISLFYTVPLRKLVVAQKGSKPGTLSKKPFPGGIPYLDISSLESNEVTQYAHKDFSLTSTEQDLLVVWDGSRSGLVFKGKEGVIGSTLMCLKLIGINRDYLYYFLKSKFEFLNKNTSGSGIPHIDSDLFFELEVPYTTLIGQENLIKSLLQKLNQGASFLQHQHKITKESLRIVDVEFEYDEQSISNSIENFKQSVITAALSGKLTAKWRAKNKITHFNQKEVEIQSSELYEKNNQHSNWEIPPAWRFTKIKNLVARFQYGTSSKSFNQGTTPVLGMGNLKDGRLVLDKLKYSSSDDELAKFGLKKGDVLFNRTNSPELVGKTAVYNSDIKAIFAGYLIRIQTLPLLTPEFLAYCLNSPFAKDYNKSIMVGSASQANINAEKLGEFLIPLPIVQEQAVIIKLVETLLVAADDTGNKYDSVLSDIKDLEKSVLNQTFDVEVKSNEGEQFNKLLTVLAKEKNALESIIKRSTDMIRANNKSLALRQKEKRSVLDLLRDSPDGSLTVEEAWQQSKYFADWDSHGYDDFFKEIEENLANSTVVEVRSKDGLTITLALKKNAR